MMGFKQRNREKQLKAAQKELEIYRELLMDNQQVSFKQAHLIEIILAYVLKEESQMPAPEDLDDEWLANMRESNLKALASMIDISKFNEDNMAKAEEE
tara:strand:+ start:160 stop:453 length:294 start_codon:yes stop_codon:yes gene_type:complete